MSRARAAMLQIGGELADSGRIAEPEDVFFLDFDETKRAAAGDDLRATVRERRDRYDAELRRRHVPRVLLSDGTELEALGSGSAAAQPGALRGTPASAGTVTAPARVILDPVGARLEPGEILVAPSTDPGWTPLFLTAGGLVMEMGGANSHGAVVAREYGIPAVVGVPRATEAITTGAEVTVDGASGVVTLPVGSRRTYGRPRAVTSASRWAPLGPSVARARRYYDCVGRRGPGSGGSSQRRCGPCAPPVPGLRCGVAFTAPSGG